MESKLEFRSEDELSTLVEAFEAGTLPHQDWTHAAHVAVAAWYIARLDPEAALDTLRRRIRHFNEMAGTPNTAARGYHETLTVFWVRVLRNEMARQDSAMPFLHRINALLRKYGGQGGLWKDYYSYNVVRSRQARARWVEPDLRPLQ